MNDRDKEWLDAMLEEWKKNRRLCDALASEHLPKKVGIDKAA